MRHGVDYDAVIDLQPRRLSQLRIRQYADTDDDHVGSKLAAVTARDPGYPAVALESGHAGTAANADALLFVYAGVEFRYHRGCHTL